MKERRGHHRADDPADLRPLGAVAVADPDGVDGVDRDRAAAVRTIDDEAIVGEIQEKIKQYEM